MTVLTAECVLPSVRREVPSRSSHTEHEKERSDSRVSAVNDVETCVGREGNKIVEFHPSVFVKVSKWATMSCPFHAEVDDEQAATGLEDAPNLAHTLLARGSAEMVEHHRAQHDVELPIGEWQRLRARDVERDVRMSARRFLPRASDHLRRGVDSANRGNADAPLGGNRERPGPTPDVEDGLTGGDFAEVEHFLTKSTLSPQREKRDQQIITLRPRHDAALAFHRGGRYRFAGGDDGGGAPSARIVTLMILSRFGNFSSRYLFVSP